MPELDNYGFPKNFLSPQESELMVDFWNNNYRTAYVNTVSMFSTARLNCITPMTLTVILRRWVQLGLWGCTRGQRLDEGYLTDAGAIMAQAEYDVWTFDNMNSLPYRKRINFFEKILTKKEEVDKMFEMKIIHMRSDKYIQKNGNGRYPKKFWGHIVTNRALRSPDKFAYIFAIDGTRRSPISHEHFCALKNKFKHEEWANPVEDLLAKVRTAVSSGICEDIFKAMVAVREAPASVYLEATVKVREGKC